MNAQMRRIGDCAEVLSGYALKARAEHEPEGTHQIVMAKHLLDCTGYRFIDDHMLRITPKGSFENYLVRNGDVLFVSRGIRNCAVVVESVPENTVASSTFYILRVKPNVHSAYLAWCLNQPPIQSQIGRIRTGAGTPIVQRSLLGNIQIPLPSLDQQRNIAELASLMAKERELQKELLSATDLYHKMLGQKLIDSLSH